MPGVSAHLKLASVQGWAFPNAQPNAKSEPLCKMLSPNNFNNWGYCSRWHSQIDFSIIKIIVFTDEHHYIENALSIALSFKRLLCFIPVSKKIFLRQEKEYPYQESKSQIQKATNKSSYLVLLSAVYPADGTWRSTGSPKRLTGINSYTDRYHFFDLYSELVLKKINGEKVNFIIPTIHGTTKYLSHLLCSLRHKRWSCGCCCN